MTPNGLADKYAAALLATGMAYEFQPRTIAYRAFLEGYSTAEAQWLKERRDLEQERDTANMFANSALDNGDVLKASVVTLRADLARVTAERDERIDTFGRTLQLEADCSALRARVAELMSQLAAYGKYAACEETTTSANLIAKCCDLEQRNGELAAALRDANASVQDALPNIGAWENQCPICGEHVDCGDFTHKPNCAAVTLPSALARAESTTPAKHVDTEDDYGCDEPLGATFARAELRAIDAAMKEARHD